MTRKKRLIIIGASGHGKVLADIANCIGYEQIYFLDDNKVMRHCIDYPVIGSSKDAINYIDADFIIGIGNAIIREKIQQELYGAGLRLATLIHPKAIVSSRAKIGKGTAIMAGAVVNPASIIGDGCIINTAATVDHDNRIDDFVHVSVGAHLAGTVSVGKRTWVGAGAIISNNVNICSDCMIGAGAVVVKDIDCPGTYIGVPAKRKEK